MDRSKPQGRTLLNWAALGAAAGFILGLFETALILWVTPTAQGDSALTLGLLLAINALILPVGVTMGVLGMVVDRFLPRRGLPDGAWTLAVIAGALLGAIPVRWLHGVAVRLRLEFSSPTDLLLDLATFGIIAGSLVTAGFVFLPVARRLLRGREERAARNVFGALSILAGFLGVHVMHRGFAVVHVTGPSAPAMICSMAVILLGLRVLVQGTSMHATRILLGAGVLTVLAGAWTFQDPGVRYVLFTRGVMARVPASALGRVSDVDGDRVAPRVFGGADCAPFDGSIGPFAREIPGDGLDQDCRGGDAAPAAPWRDQEGGPWRDCLSDLGDRPFNLVVITVDAMRGEVIEKGLTPNILPFLRRSAWFRRAYAPSTHTRASIPAIVTGLTPSDLGGPDWIPRGGVLRPLPSLAMELSGRGFQTSFLGRLEGDAEAFDGYPLTRGFERYGFPLLDPSGSGGPKDRYTAAALTDTALRFLRTEAREPFLLWLHHLDPHAPYVPIGTEAMAEPDASHYERGVAYTMIHVGRFLDAFAKSRLADRTIVVLISDHGEDLGERGREGHGSDLFEESIHVPLVLHIPGCPGVVIDAPVSLVELSPTLAGLLGIPVHEWTLLDAIAGRDRPLPVVSEAYVKGDLRRAVIDERFKLLVDVGHRGRLLFDLAEDPDEFYDLYGRDEAATEKMEGLYQRWLDRPGIN